jgi:RimJ/RimL family protein N-acetyltransferase
MIYPLFSERLSIEPLAAHDLEAFVSYRQNPEIARFQSWEPTYSLQQAQELLETQVGVTIPTESEWLQLALRERGSNELVGDLALHAIDDLQEIFEIGFTISPKHQGKGYAKEGASTLINYLSGKLGAKKFVANTDSRNAASIRVLLAIGFTWNPAKGWTEDFKNEVVTVHHFERD